MKFDYYFLDELIWRKGISLADLAEAAGMDPQELEAAITGHAEMTAGTIKAISSVLDLSPEEVDRAFFTEQLPEQEFTEKFKSLSAASQRQIEEYIDKLSAEEAWQLVKANAGMGEYMDYFDAEEGDQQQ